MRVKPHVDTLDVERVLAFRQQPTLFALLELRQAHGAFYLVGVRFRGELEGREEAEDGGIEAARGGSGVRLDVEHQVAVGPPASAAEVLAPPRSEEVPPRVDVYANHEHDHSE